MKEEETEKYEGRSSDRGHLISLWGASWAVPRNTHAQYQHFQQATKKWTKEVEKGIQTVAPVAPPRQGSFARLHLVTVTSLVPPVMFSPPGAPVSLSGPFPPHSPGTIYATGLTLCRTREDIGSHVMKPKTPKSHLATCQYPLVSTLRGKCH